MIHLQNRKIVSDSVPKLAYDFSKRKSVAYRKLLS